MEVPRSEVKTSRKPLSKRWWLWALIGIILFFWLDACATEKLGQLEEALQAEEQKVLVFASLQPHVDASPLYAQAEIE